ncbi:MAG: GAF domain-containing protein, partial [Ferruginibacter sp.]
MTENDTLVSLSIEISCIRTREDMLHLIHHSLKQYVCFDDCFLLLYSADSRTCKPYIFHAEKKRSEKPGFENYVNAEYPVIDNGIEGIQQPVVTDIEWLSLHKSEQVLFMHRAGLKEFVTIKLIERNKLIGLLVLLSEQKESFTPQALELLRNISYQVAIMTANLIAAEEIANREYQQTLLLSLSNEIASVRNKNDLLQVLNIKLKALFPIIGFGITLQNEDGVTHSPFVVDSDDPIKNDIDFEKVITLKYSIEDGVYDRIVQTSEPVLINVDDIKTRVQTAAYVAFWKKLNVRQVVGNGLGVAGKNMGCLIFLLQDSTTERIDHALMKGVCAAVSVAVSNVKSNEEIIKREEEKTMLLAFSHEVAGLRTRNDFFPVINSQLKKIFSLDRFGIANINEDGRTHNAFMMGLGNPATDDEDFEYIITTKYDVNDQVFGGIMNSPEPVMLDVDQLAKDASLPAYVGFWKKVGFKFLLCVQLRVGGNNIGVIFFDIEEATIVNNLRIDVLKGISSQIAVAVSNILSNEDITRREQERALLLSLNMDMVAVRTNEELMLLINQRLKTLLNFSHTHLCKINEDKTTITPYLYDPTSRSRKHPRYKELKSGKFPIHDGIMNKAVSTPFPVLTDLEEVKDQQGTPLYVIINYDSGIRQIVTVRFTRGNEPFGFWMIF